MSLQGSIETFAIADVLRLLAATSKSGRLHVQGPARAGTVWVDHARVLAAESPSTPHASGPVDIVFQLLRFERGSFRFEIDKYPPEPGEPLEIELALGEAESMLAEWRQLEQQIPSPDAWVQLKSSLDSSSVTLTAEEWTTLVAVSGGRSVADIGDALESGELQTSRAVSRLLDLGLVEVGARPAAAPATRSTGTTDAAPAPQPSPTATSDTGPDDAKVGSNGSATSSAPPAPPAPPAAPSWSPADAPSNWAASELPPVAPPLDAAPPAPAPPERTRTDAGLARPKEGGFVTPAETDLDDSKPTPEPFAYPRPSDGASDVFTYPPVPEAPSWEPTAPAAGSNGGGTGDNGYPPLPPPLPPAFGSAAPGAAPTLPPPPAGPTWTPPADHNRSDDAPAAAEGGGTASIGVMPAALAPKVDPGWMGSLGEAIAKADALPAAEGGSSKLSTTAWSTPGSVPPPPPAPAAPVGPWASPASLFENGLPERLAPPPPPPPPVSGGQQNTAEPSAQVSPTLLTGSVTTLPDAGSPATDTKAEQAEQSAENAEDIERQLFNLSPRAREAVKQSSGLYDGGGRR